MKSKKEIGCVRGVMITTHTSKDGRVVDSPCHCFGSRFRTHSTTYCPWLENKKNMSENELKPENIDGVLDMYLIEYWTNGRPLLDTSDGNVEMCKSQPFGIASTLDAAFDVCSKNKNYGGERDDWHWCITRYRVNQDVPHATDPVQEWMHFTRDLQPCDAQGKVQKREVTLSDKVEDLTRRVEKLEADNAPIGG